MKRAKKTAKKIGKKPIKKVSELDQFVIDRVKKIRRDKGLSQASLSAEMNYSYGFIAQIESKTTPAHYNINHLNQIAKILKCSLYDFFPKDPI